MNPVCPSQRLNLINIAALTDNVGKADIQNIPEFALPSYQGGAPKKCAHVALAPLLVDR